VSPRDRIELIDTGTLQADLSLAEVEAIEEERAQRDDVSVVSLPTAGFSTYPAMISLGRDYPRALEVIAHEWTHGFLFFYPLGFNYYRSPELRAMNETVADLIGRELATAVLERWPAPPSEPLPDPTPTVDVNAELRALREEVDSLLAAGRIEEAEVLMEQRRLELVAQGARLRKLNQAYFAFINLYAGEAGNPAATNPIGPKIDELRARSASLADFVSVVSGLTSVEDLDRALAAPTP
jgi:hypothetical protein